MLKEFITSTPVRSDEENSDQEEEDEAKNGDPSYVPDPDEISGRDNNDDQNDYDTDHFYE